jgi:hypothetical protein
MRSAAGRKIIGCAHDVRGRSPTVVNAARITATEYT